MFMKILYSLVAGFSEYLEMISLHSTSQFCSSERAGVCGPLRCQQWSCFLALPPFRPVLAREDKRSHKKSLHLPQSLVGVAEIWVEETVFFVTIHRMNVRRVQSEPLVSLPPRAGQLVDVATSFSQGLTSLLEFKTFYFRPISLFIEIP